MKKRDRRQEDPGSLWINTMCELIKGGVFAGITTILFLFLCAVLVSTGLLRERWMEGAGLACYVLGALIGGIYSVKAIQRRPLLVGLAVGGVLFLLLLTAGFLAYETASIEQGGVGILCACLCGGGIAGILGGTRKKRRR